MTLQLAEILWFGGTRRDGRINNFGFVKLENQQEVFLHKSALSDQLKKETLYEGYNLFVEVDLDEEKEKIVQAYALSEISEVQTLQLLSKSKYNFVQHVLHRISFDQINYTVLEQCMLDCQDVKIYTILIKNYVKNATIEQQCSFVIHNDKMKILPKEILSSLVTTSFTYDPVMEQKLIETLKLQREPLSVPFALVDTYPNVFSYVQLEEEESILKSLKDKRFSKWQLNVIKQTLTEKEKTIIGYAPYRTEIGDTFCHLSIHQWFHEKTLHQLIQQSSLYPYFLRSYLNNAKEEVQLTNGFTYAATYFKEHSEFPEQYWEKYHNYLLSSDIIFNYLPKKMQFDIVSNNPEIQIEKMLSIFETFDSLVYEQYWEKLNSAYRDHEAFFKYAPTLEKVEIIYDRLKQDPDIFLHQPPLVKNYLIYKIAKNYMDIQHWLNIETVQRFGQLEENKLIKALLYVLYEGINRKLQYSYPSINLEDHVLQRIDAVIYEQAKARQGFDLLRLLPSCDVANCNVRYCEGKVFNVISNFGDEESEEKTIHYCPRTRKTCTAYQIHSGLYSGSKREPGSRTSPNLALPYDLWSIEELFCFANVDPLQGTHHLSQSFYGNKIAGWVNRLEEIIERMKCSNPDCHEPFKVNFEYSRRFHAVYNATMFHCKKNEDGHLSDHDHHIYLNHCRCCNKLIDSRESKYQIYDGGYYICINCAAADPETPYNPVWDQTPGRHYQQGDICPACNYRGEPMIDTKAKWKKCSQCSHEIKITK